MEQTEECFKKNDNNNNSMTNTNIQWNIWQQFQWPNQPEQSRWSKFSLVVCAVEEIFTHKGLKFKVKCQLHVCDRIYFLLFLHFVCEF